MRHYAVKNSRNKLERLRLETEGVEGRSASRKVDTHTREGFSHA